MVGLAWGGDRGTEREERETAVVAQMRGVGRCCAGDGLDCSGGERDGVSEGEGREMARPAVVDGERWWVPN